MDAVQFDGRMNKLRLIRREIALALVDVEYANGADFHGHALWHAFQPYFGEGSDLVTWILQLERLLPLLVEEAQCGGDDRWGTLAGGINVLIQDLSVMDPTPHLNCGGCYL